MLDSRGKIFYIVISLSGASGRFDLGREKYFKLTSILEMSWPRITGRL